MAQRNSESVPGYMDGVHVKIAEKYKPPKRIILPTNTQRLTVDIVNGPNFSYDFSLEESVKSKMKELKEARNYVKLDRAKRYKNCQEQNVRDTDSDLKSVIPNTDSVSYPNDISDDTTIPATVTKVANEASGDSSISVLLPTQMTLNTITPNHCDIPTPINISDFENDTASPFDNMELKTLNDLAELAQVLQPSSAGAAVSSPNYTTNMYSNHYHLNSTDVNMKQSGFNNDGCVTQSTYIPINDNRPINGYYTNYLITATNTHSERSHIHPLHSQNTYNHSQQYDYLNLNESHVNNVSLPQNQKLQLSAATSATKTTATNTSRSVPDIINSLQRDLMKTRIEEANAAMKMPTPPTNSSWNKTPKAVAVVQLEPINMNLPNPYPTLSAKQQQIVKEVALMGFPLDRVARACEIIGPDQSKLVEHMIVMSQLLDLGFNEQNITKALLKCDNDRDKALDYLVA